jgi:uncharacterized protein YggE
MWSRIIFQFLVLLSFSLIISAQDIKVKQNQITVLGSVELKEIADEVSLYFTVKGVGENLRLAVEEAEKKTKVIADKLLALGINKSDISTSDFLSGENYGDKAFLSSSRDFKAMIVTLIKTDSLELMKDILFEISEADVESISNIAYSYKDELGLRRRARIEAGLKAKEKADDITSALGVKVGKVLSIEEVQSTQTFNNQNQDNFLYRRGGIYPNPYNPVGNYNIRTGRIDVDETKGSGFFAQTISVTSQVKVTFAIE